MPSTEHAEQPEEHEPPPLSRRDQRSPAAGDNANTCDCGGCREFRAIHGRLSPELPLPERLAKRARDRAAQCRYDESDGHQPTRQAA